MKENDFKSDTLKCYKTHAVNSDKAIEYASAERGYEIACRPSVCP